MGCGLSASRRVAPEDWSSAYKSSARKLTQQHRAATQKISRQRTERLSGESGTIVEKKGSDIVTVDHYKIMRALGKGAFGEVFLAQHGDEKFAIKVLRKSKLKKAAKPRQGPEAAWGRGRTIAALEQVKAEVATMKKITHPNCVQIFDVVLDPQCDEVFIVLEYVAGGTSQPYDADGRPILLPERTIWSHLRHLVMGLEYLHMHGIIHRDIKPENLLLTKPNKHFPGSLGILKIADFGTSCLCEGDANAQKTAGTPSFFSPELCSVEASGTYDGRVVDLWAVGVTIYLWCCGVTPYYVAGSTALLMAALAQAEAVTDAPKQAPPGLAALVRGLLTRDVAARLTLGQLRSDAWLTDDGAQPLPHQPTMKIQVSPHEIAQAFTNRKAVAVGSAAGPSAMGKTLSFCARPTAEGVPSEQKSEGASSPEVGKGAAAGWLREGENTIRKRGTEAEATIYRTLAAAGNLAPHIPVIYSISEVEADEGSEGGAHADILMQDLVAEMMRPCALAVVMGSRTVTPADWSDEGSAPRPEFLRAMEEIDAQAPTESERADGVSRRQYLSFLDGRSSTSTLGFRIDAAKTVVDCALAPLPLHEGLSLATLHDEADVEAAIATFLQGDAALASSFLLKLRTFAAALSRSPVFPTLSFLRSTLLFVYDDAARESKIEMKITNVGASYALSDEGRITHVEPWDGSAMCHEDGYLVGVQSLTRIMKRIAKPVLPDEEADEG